VLYRNSGIQWGCVECFLWVPYQSISRLWLRFVEDTSIDNYTGTVTASNQNAFFKCIFERGSADLYQCHIKNGSRNTFVGCSFNGPVSRTVPVVYTDSTQAGQNLWEHCRFNAGTVSAYSIVYNNGDYNRFRDCMFTDWSGTADVILTTSPVFISRCYIEDARGQSGFRLDWLPIMWFMSHTDRQAARQTIHPWAMRISPITMIQIQRNRCGIVPFLRPGMMR